MSLKRLEKTIHLIKCQKINNSNNAFSFCFDISKYVPYSLQTNQTYIGWQFHLSVLKIKKSWTEANMTIGMKPEMRKGVKGLIFDQLTLTNQWFQNFCFCKQDKNWCVRSLIKARSAGLVLPMWKYHSD